MIVGTVLNFQCNNNTELNDLRKIICLRKTQISVERISVYKVIENGRQCMPCSTEFSMTLETVFFSLNINFRFSQSNNFSQII